MKIDGELFLLSICFNQLQVEQMTSKDADAISSDYSNYRKLILSEKLLFLKRFCHI